LEDPKVWLDAMGQVIK